MGTGFGRHNAAQTYNSMAATVLSPTLASFALAARNKFASQRN